jgi:predicted chitinase
MSKTYLSPAQISAATKAAPENVAVNWPLIVEALERNGINWPLVQAGMAATIAIETGNFKPRAEALAKDTNSRVYQLQMKYWPKGYYGRGYIQLTGEKNYIAAGNALKIDLAGNPNLALQPKIAARIAAWFFKANGIHNFCMVSDWEKVRRAVNGPLYYQDQKTLGKLIGYCNLLAGFASLKGGNYGQP